MSRRPTDDRREMKEEAYIINIVSEMYDYTQPDEYRTDPHDNDIPYDWMRKDG